MSASSHSRLLLGGFVGIGYYLVQFLIKTKHGVSEYLQVNALFTLGHILFVLIGFVLKNPITRVKVLNRIFESTVSVKSIMLVIHGVITMEIKTFHRVSTESIMLIHSMGRYGGKKPQPIKQKSAPWCALVVSINFDF